MMRSVQVIRTDGRVIYCERGCVCDNRLPGMVDHYGFRM